MATTEHVNCLEAEKILHESKAILDGDHFVYVTGHHGAGWVDKDAIYPHTDRICELARLLSLRVAAINAEVVCGPAMGGLVLSQWLAHHLGVLSVFAEHDDKFTRSGEQALRPPFVLKRHYDKLVNGRRVLVVDDIVNTGHSSRQTVAAVAAAGGKVVATAAICTRGNASPQDAGSDTFIYLVEAKIPAWSAESCRLCKEGVPVNVEYAHGREFVAAAR